MTKDQNNDCNEKNEYEIKEGAKKGPNLGQVVVDASGAAVNAKVSLFNKNTEIRVEAGNDSSINGSGNVTDNGITCTLL